MRHCGGSCSRYLLTVRCLTTADFRARQAFNMEYAKALEQAAMLADRTGKSAFIIGLDGEYVVLSSEPKLLGGRSIQEILPTAGKAEPDPDAA